MNKQIIVDKILKDRKQKFKRSQGSAFAPSNIALCKYWGKRDVVLNLPMTSSLSISLKGKGAKTTLSLCENHQDNIVLNGQTVAYEHPFASAISAYLDLFREDQHTYYQVETHTNIPVAAGLASSASGFAALAKALNEFYAWELDLKALSILARLGSGSASRSLWEGFVEWQKGEELDGMDSHGVPWSYKWPALRVGLLIFHSQAKSLSSRLAMESTVQTSPFYRSWPDKVEEDLQKLKLAIEEQDFKVFGETSESNALTMHALMMTASKPILYSTEETLRTQKHIWKCREQGLPIYFTQDAGPNLKVLFLDKDRDIVKQEFPNIEILAPFEDFEER